MRLFILVLALGQTKEEPPMADVKPLATAQANGELKSMVYKLPLKDGGVVFYAPSIDGGTAPTFVDHSPCRKRPAATPVGKCSAPDGGDFGENVMQPGQFTDNGGCIEVPCTIFFGDPAP